MPGVSAEEHHQAYALESSIAGSFLGDNGYVLPVSGLDFMDHGAQADFERSSSSRDSNLSRRFLAKSLSMGSGSCYSDDGEVSFADSFRKDGGPKEEAFMAGSPLSSPFYGSLAGSPSDVALASLQKFLPSNNEDEASWPAVDVYSCDEFRMYEFKVRRCMRGRSHDWTECPFAHPGEKARRRDPRRFHYSGTACPDFRKGSCRRGDACEFAHGVFECWLHPARYRTQPCKDGRNCRRRVCFFAHTPEQLRLLPGANSGSRALKNSSYDGSPLRHAVSASNFDGSFAYDGSGGGCYDGSQTAGSPRCGHMGYLCKASQQANLSCASQFQMSSPTSTLVGHSHSPPPLSPPLSPADSPPLSPDSATTNWALGYGISCSSPTARGLKPVNYGSNNFEPPMSPASLAQVHASFGLQSPRRYLASVPSVSIPQSNSSPKSAVQSSKAMADLITSLQQLELSGEATPLWLQAQAAHSATASSTGSAAAAHGSPRASNLRHCSYSLPCTPTKSRWDTKFDNWEAEATEEPLQRVESGRDLRAKIYGRLTKENPENTESPDLGWVNELIK